MKKVLAALPIVAVLAASALTPTPAAAATVKVVKTSYSDDLFSVTYTASGPQAKHLDFAEWKALGFATPQVVAWVEGSRVVKQSGSDNLYTLTDGRQHLLTFQQWANGGYKPATVQSEAYVKYPWSSDIYAVSFFGSARSEWVWRKLNFNEWVKLGNPTARNAGWIQGSTFYKYPGNDALFVDLAGSRHQLTFSEWAAAGYPTPTTLGCAKPQATASLPQVTKAPAGQKNVVSASPSWITEYSKTSELRQVSSTVVYGQVVGRDVTYVDSSGFGNTMYYVKPTSCLDGPSGAYAKGGSDLVRVRVPVVVTSTEVQHLGGWPPLELGSTYALFLNAVGTEDAYSLSNPWAQFEVRGGQFVNASGDQVVDDLGLLAKLTSR